MTNHTEQPNNPEQPKNLAGTVLARITAERIEPTPRWQFVFSELTMWVLWLGSIVVGSSAVAVMIFVSVQASYSLYEATHDTLFAYVVEVAPVLWFSIFALMGLLAYFNLRHTKKGYKYPVWLIFVSSITASLLGGVLLNGLNGGYFIDTLLAKAVPVYPSFEKFERQVWLNPEEGRLVGRVVTKMSEEPYVTFVDVENVEWDLGTPELAPKDMEALESGELVRVLGIKSSSSDNAFHGCGVLAWLYDENIGMNEIRREKKEFIDRLKRYKGKAGERFEAIEEAVVAASSSVVAVSSACARHRVVGRLGELVTP